MKKLIATVAAAVIAGSAFLPQAQAGDREWATAGKVLAGVGAGLLIARAFEPVVVYHEPAPVYVASAPVYVQQPTTVYVGQPAPVVVQQPVTVNQVTTQRTEGIFPGSYSTTTTTTTTTTTEYVTPQTVVAQQPVIIQQPIVVQQPVYVAPAPVYYVSPAPVYYHHHPRPYCPPPRGLHVSVGFGRRW